MTLQYSLIVEWSDDDQKFVVSFPEFGDLAHTAGATYAEAVRNGEEALALLVETYQQEGRALPTVRTFTSARA